jgi:hypothetical protein
MLGMRGSQPEGHLRPDIAALRYEALVPEHVRHQRREQVSHGNAVQTWLVRTEGEPVARQRWRDHGEGVPGIATEAGGLGE